MTTDDAAERAFQLRLEERRRQAHERVQRAFRWGMLKAAGEIAWDAPLPVVTDEDRPAPKVAPR